ncbi:MAG: DinB family protein [Gemmatimonadota bacterium]
MTNQEMLARHFELVYHAAGENLKGVTHEDSLARPAAGGNCANWILGHLVDVHNGLMQVIGEDPVWESEQLARLGYEPIESPEGAIAWDTLCDRFLGSRERCLAAVRALTDDELAEELPDPFGETTTRAGLLTILAFHQTYHAGQLGLARRFAGLPGIIKAPGQEQA